MRDIVRIWNDQYIDDMGNASGLFPSSITIYPSCSWAIKNPITFYQPCRRLSDINNLICYAAEDFVRKLCYLIAFL